MPTHSLAGEHDPELQNLLAMMAEYAAAVGSTNEIVRIGDAGYAVRLGNRPVNPKGDWIVYDLDDTIIGYTLAKSVRLDHYRHYLRAHRIVLEEDAAEDLIAGADTLSRWVEQGRKLYHLNAHITLLAWATETVSRLDAAERTPWANGFKQQAERYAAEMPPRTPAEWPFYYNDGQLVFKDQVAGADRIGDLLDEVFDAMIRPERNQELLDAMARLGSDTQGQAFCLNQGILTYGTPDFQLRKILELLHDLHEQGVEIGLSYVFLARAKKGVYLEALLNLDPYTNPDAPHSDLAEDLFNDIPHAILLVDDDPVELESFVSSNGKYDDFRYDLDLMGVRYRHRRLGTKNFEVAATYGEHEGRIGHHLAQDNSLGLPRVIYSLLATQVVPPKDSRAAREERWHNSSAKQAFYLRMAEASPDADRLHAKHRESEYLAGRRLPREA